MITVKDVSDYINKLAPYHTMCSWDNCGLLIGNPEAEVNKIAFVLDLTKETLAEAEKNNADLIITHHPVIFNGKKEFLRGDTVFDAAVKGINVISAHTCFDCADGGVNDCLCDILNLNNVKKIPSDECTVPMLRMGNTEKETDAKDFASFVAKSLNTTVRLVNCEKKVNKVAVCGGSGMSFLNDVVNSGADLFVTGDISHHDMLEAKERGISIVAAGHFETECPAMTYLKNIVSSEFTEIVTIVLKQDNPVEFIN